MLILAFICFTIGIGSLVPWLVLITLTAVESMSPHPPSPLGLQEWLLIWVTFMWCVFWNGLGCISLYFMWGA